jgi:hypothetical protein
MELDMSRDINFLPAFHPFLFLSVESFQHIPNGISASSSPLVPFDLLIFGPGRLTYIAVDERLECTDFNRYDNTFIPTISRVYKVSKSRTQ